jgi:Protein of unknown function (DUF3344)/Ig domain of plant-specific actin-binding protein
MSAPISRAARLLCATLALALVAAPARAADAPFTPRFATTVRGDVTAVGNTLMTCPIAAANCAAARNGAAYNDNDFAMEYVDVDGDAATFDSSSATVSLPAGATVVWAGLYWAADSGSASAGSVKFKVGGGAYTDVAAAQVLTSSTWPTRYRAFKDVTSLLPPSGSGTYTVANVQATTGTDRFAGWALLVAYRDDAKPVRRLNVYDGLGSVDTTHSFQTTIAPFHTPANGTVTTKAGLLAFEGDAGMTGEASSFNGHALTDGLNPSSNAMNSTIESGGAHFTAKSPNYVNQLGMDLDTYTGNPGALANDQSSASLAFSSAGEFFMPAAFFLVSDEGPATSTGGGPAIGAPSGGTATVGQALSANPGNWNGTGPLTYAYQWQRCDANGANCVDIAGATGSTYTPSPADAGGTVRVVVTVTNAAGTSTPVASAPIAVAALPPVNTSAPVLSGPAAPGQPLTANAGTWSDPGTAYSYQWQRCDANGANCANVPGANGATYTPTEQDAGSRLRVVVTATNDVGSAVAVSAPSAVVGGSDVASVPGSLVAETSCQQLVGGAKYRRVAVAGIGTVRVRAYTNGPARESSPVRLTTEITGGHARSVRYAIDGRDVAASRGARHPGTLTPAQLGKVGAHTLRTTLRGRRGGPRTVVLKLTTQPCQTLFTAQRWRTTAGTGLRLRVDSRTALRQLSFAVPSALLPSQTAARRTAGFIRLYVAGRRTPVRFPLALPKRGARAVLLGAPGKPTVTRTRSGLLVTGLPASTAVAELTLYRVTKVDSATPQRIFRVSATVASDGSRAATFSARPKPSR